MAHIFSRSTPHQPVIQQRKLEADLLDEQEAAALLRVKPGTLSVWRSTGRYRLPFIKIGRLVRYRRSDILAWAENRTRDGATA